MIKGKRPTYKSSACTEYHLNGSEIITLPLLTPPYQADLNSEKVAEMVASYQANPEFGRFKNTIVVAQSGQDLYLVDGQHRVEMMKRVQVTYPYKVLIYPIRTDDEMRLLFREMNYDSHKNLAYVSLGADALRVVTDLYDHLASKPFTKKRGDSLLYTVRAFVDAIAGYTQRFTSSDALLKDLEERHTEFKNRTEFTHFYAEERKCIETGYILPIKGCNFVPFLLNGEEPKYTGKGVKKYITIPLTLKKEVWKEYVGLDKGMTKCFVCNGNDIFQLSFVGGHVKAKSQGGDTSVANLRPICQMCNSSMGSNNMNDFKKILTR